MAILDHHIFKSVTISEVLHQNWTKNATKHLKSPNVLAMIKQFNRIGHWVIGEIVMAKEIKKRLEVLTRMIQVRIIHHHHHRLFYDHHYHYCHYYY
jgi:hypothetical protein